jgi:hypothetical protein
MGMGRDILLRTLLLENKEQGCWHSSWPLVGMQDSLQSSVVVVELFESPSVAEEGGPFPVE